MITYPLNSISLPQERIPFHERCVFLRVDAEQISQRKPVCCRSQSSPEPKRDVSWTGKRARPFLVRNGLQYVCTVAFSSTVVQSGWGPSRQENSVSIGIDLSVLPGSWRFQSKSSWSRLFSRTKSKAIAKKSTFFNIKSP